MNTEEPTVLLDAIRATRFHYTSEADLQAGLASVLKEAGLAFNQEHRLGPRSRLDFLVDGGLGIEVKINGSAADLGYQILRYLEHEDVRAMVVVTTRAGHRELPRELAGKPVWVVHLFSSAF
jgi:hypothetical protein